MSVRKIVYSFRFRVYGFRLLLTAAAFCQSWLRFKVQIVKLKIKGLHTAAAYCRYLFHYLLPSPYFILTTLFFLLSTFYTFSQDIHFSQFEYSPLNLNCANSGMFDGDQRFNATHRRQWSSVSEPFTTFTISYDRLISIPSEKGSHHNAGLIINSDKAGAGDFGTLQAALSYSYLFALGNDSVNFFSAGIQFGFVQRSVNFASLTFDNQFNGDAFNANAATGENLSRTTFTYADINLGLGWTSRFDNGALNGGISIQHINKPNQTFYDGAKEQLPVRWQVNLNPYFETGASLTLIPALLYMHQNTFSEFTGGMEFKFDLRKNTVRNFAFGLGGYGRLKDAIIPAVAVYYNNLRVGLSYDINTSSLKRASNKKGGPEISVQYILKKIRTKLNRSTCCPVY